MTCSHHTELPRRGFFGLLGVGLAAVLSGCASPPTSSVPGTAAAWRTDSVGPTEPVWPTEPPVPDDDVPSTSASSTPWPAETAPPTSSAPRTGGRPVELRGGPAGTQQLALTVDDGYCVECVAGFVAFARRTGIHLTFSPNGIYSSAWAPQARVLKPLIEAGQVQIINHTFTHPNLTWMSAGGIRTELERNERWITQTFATTARPYYRPPFGFHNRRVDTVAADIGFDRVVMWNGSFGNAKAVTTTFLMDQARRYLQPGVIMLAHANHDDILGLFDEITQLIGERNLEPVTLDEMFGTDRPAKPVTRFR